jgi:uncharacterized protein YbbC (DUF1343 family)
VTTIDRTLVVALGSLALIATVFGCAISTNPTPGFDVLARADFEPLRGKRVGIVANHTALDSEFRHLVDVLAERDDVHLVAVFAPEHGFRGLAQAGESVGSERDPTTGVPIHSLYGEHRRPTPSMLEGMDVLLFDIQDVGVRAYTYLSTLAGALEEAARAGVEFWVLDRPNPIGGVELAGPVLVAGAESFVGSHTIPLRHGLTAGEFARLFDRERNLDARLRVIAVEGWKRDELWPSGQAWVAPSPNVPTAETALLYAGFVLIEGTNLSEGRGTTRPFQLTGAPWLDGLRVARDLNMRRLPGVRFRATAFEPTFSKYAGEVCRGVEAHVTDRAAFRPFATVYALLSIVRHLHPTYFRFKNDVFDRLSGTVELRESIEAGRAWLEVKRELDVELEAFRRRCQPILIYN